MKMNYLNLFVYFFFIPFVLVGQHFEESQYHFPELVPDIEQWINTPNAVAELNDTYRIIAAYRKQRSTTEAPWIPLDSTQYIYDEQERLSEVKSLTWNAPNWNYSQRTSYTWNENDQITSSLQQSWNGTEWVFEEDNFRFTQAYNLEGNITLYHGQLWKSGTWIDFYKATYYYDTLSNRLATAIIQNADEAGQLINSRKTLYLEYNEEGEILESILQFWENGAWVSDQRRLIEYGIDGLKAQVLYQKSSENGWLDDRLLTCQYNSEGLETMILNQEWNQEETSWENTYRALLEYDEGFNLLMRSFDRWETSVENWKNFRRTSYTYDEHGNEKTIWHQIWSEEDEVWQADTHTTYYYNIFVHTENQNRIDPAAISLFPNPAKDQLWLKINDSILTNKPLQVKVLNSAGQVQKTIFIESLDDSYTLDTGAWLSGIYFLQIIQQDSFLTKKLVIEH